MLLTQKRLRELRDRQSRERQRMAEPSMTHLDGTGDGNLVVNTPAFPTRSPANPGFVHLNMVLGCPPILLVDDLSDEQRTELDQIERGVPDLERQIRAAVVAVEDEENASRDSRRQ